MGNLMNGMSHGRYIELHTIIYNYCTSSRAMTHDHHVGAARGANLMGSELYNHLKDYLRTHLNAMRAEAQTRTDDELLKYYASKWTEYTTGAKYLNHIFAYLNRHWVKREIDEGRKTIYEVYTLCLVSWRDHMFAQLQSSVMAAVIKITERQRNGETIESGLIKAVVESFVALGLDENDSKKTTLDVYKVYFEKPFLDATDAYYTAESEKFLAENSVPDYMKKVETRLVEEETRILTHLHNTTTRPLSRTCEDVLIRRKLPIIVEEFQNLLDQDKTDDMARMYSLCIKVDGLEKLRNKIETHVRRMGLAAVAKVSEGGSAAGAAAKKPGAPAAVSKDEEGEQAEADDKEPGGVDPKVYVESLLSVHKKYDAMVREAFKNDAGFVAALDKACREFVNRNNVCRVNSSKSPELLAKFCDSLLRKSAKVAEEGEVEEALNNVMIVFKYVEDKDVFQKFYSKMLAKRLVNESSASDDLETSMISKLKEACGFEYTSKLQRMFTDMATSKDLNNAFKAQQEQNHDQADVLDFSIMVLGTAHWPLQPPNTGYTIPEDLIKTYDRFQRFYNQKHNGRKLNWLFNMGKADLRTNYMKQKQQCTFNVSHFEMAVLLQYNDRTKYSWEELSVQTGIAADVLKGQMGILLKAKVLLLASGTLGDNGSQYELNEDFKSKRIRLNLIVPVRSEVKQEADETHKTVEEDRKLLIQAAIVRIMKTRKVLNHVGLMNEVITQLSARFKPKVPDIKKCIDILLEKEYIERTEGQKDTYSYVA
ncbi:hypothetical protein HDU93_006718 [Gonapodya sp. JEL0774]|nr:hypothetical protein HDU93_006718 [Gonapodya sp. JEL0774]